MKQESISDFDTIQRSKRTRAIAVATALAVLPLVALAQENEVPPETLRPTLYQLYPPSVTEPPRSPDTEPGFSDPWAVEDGYGRSRISEVPGEYVDPRTGAVTLSVTDLTVPGNGALDIVVSRTRRDTFFASPGPDYLENRSFQDTMADWSLDVPYVQLRSTEAYDQDVGGIMAQSPVFYSDNPDTCGNPFPRDPFQTQGFNPTTATRTALFGGVQLVGMGAGRESELLLRSVSGNDTERTRARQLETPYGTADQLVVQCGSSTYDNQLRPGAKSAFSVHSPDGSTYYFAEPSSGNNLSISPVDPIKPWGHLRVYLSQVRNRHGQTLSYRYDEQPEIQSLYPYVNGVRRPDRRDYAYLTSIRADAAGDGREVSFTWECNPYGKGRSLGLANCGNNENTYRGAPLFRLKSMTANGRTWEYRYNDGNPAGPNQSRFLTEVKLPNNQSWRYSQQPVPTAAPGSCGLYPYGFGSGIDYTVIHPEGGTAVYKTRPRRIIRYNSCRYVTSLMERVVSPNDGEAHTTRWCYEASVQGNYDPLWTHVLGPTRAESLRFRREHNDADGKWKEGLLVESRIYAPIAACPVGEPAQNFLEKTTYEYQRGDRITDPSSSAFPSYAEAINAARPVVKVRVERPDTGTFETSYDQLDRYFRPQLTRQSLAGQLSTAASSRRWKSTSEDRAVRLIVSPQPTQLSVNWLVPAIDNVDVKYSVNGAKEQSAATNTSSTGLTSISRSAGASYVIRIYPAGQTSATSRIAEVLVPAGDQQLKYEFRWLLGLPKRRCLVASDTANCATTDGILQAEESEFDIKGNLVRETNYGLTRLLSHNGEGDVASITDVRGHTTQFQDYYRGVPRRVLLPGTDGATRTLVMNRIRPTQHILDLRPRRSDSDCCRQKWSVGWVGNGWVRERGLLGCGGGGAVA